MYVTLTHVFIYNSEHVSIVSRLYYIHNISFTRL